MGSFQNPVSGGPRDPFDKPIRVDPVEEDRFAKNDQPPQPEKNSLDEKLGIAAFLLQMLRKAVDFFLENRSTPKSIELDAQAHLLLLKASFEILKKEDRSQDVQFLNQLSQIWLQILEDALHFKNETAALRFKTLIKAIQHYPERQLHTFGYYLAENANQKWVPFPYMELVQKIHSEHEKNSTSSALTEWTTLIDELASLLKPD